MPPPDERSVAVEIILQYLTDHEQAADTAAGIAGWWVGRGEPRVSAEAVEQALTDLVRSGILEQQQLPDGTTIYRRAGRKT